MKNTRKGGEEDTLLYNITYPASSGRRRQEKGKKEKEAVSVPHRFISLDIFLCSCPWPENQREKGKEESTKVIKRGKGER